MTDEKVKKMLFTNNLYFKIKKNVYVLKYKLIINIIQV